jgi:hypothetical protein
MRGVVSRIVKEAVPWVDANIQCAEMILKRLSGS